MKARLELIGSYLWFVALILTVGVVSLALLTISLAGSGTV